jgi:hypothetical protein
LGSRAIRSCSSRPRTLVAPSAMRGLGLGCRPSKNVVSGRSKTHRIVAKVAEPSIAAAAENAPDPSGLVTVIDAVGIRRATDGTSAALALQECIEARDAKPVTFPSVLGLDLSGISRPPRAMTPRISLARLGEGSKPSLPRHSSAARLAAIPGSPIRRTTRGARYAVCSAHRCPPPLILFYLGESANIDLHRLRELRDNTVVRGTVFPHEHHELRGRGAEDDERHVPHSGPVDDALTWQRHERA